MRKFIREANNFNGYCLVKFCALVFSLLLMYFCINMKVLADTSDGTVTSTTTVTEESVVFSANVVNKANDTFSQNGSKVKICVSSNSDSCSNYVTEINEIDRDDFSFSIVFNSLNGGIVYVNGVEKGNLASYFGVDWSSYKNVGYKLYFTFDLWSLFNNWTEEEVSGLIDDKFGPFVSSDDSFSSNEWAESHSVTLKYVDSFSGVNKISYCWSKITNGCSGYGNLVEVDESDVVVSDVVDGYTLNGELYLFHFALDNAGNRSMYNYSGPYYFDKKAPIHNSTSPETDTGYTQPINVTYIDEESGISKVYYCWTTNSDGCTPTLLLYESELGASEVTAPLTRFGVTGTYYLSHYAVDVSGKSSTILTYGPYYFDSVPPMGSTTSPESDTTYTKSKSISVTYTDELSGVNKVYYCWTTNLNGCTPESTMYVSTTNDVAIITKSTETGIFYLSHIAEDAAGNKSSAISTKGPYYFDNTSPEVTLVIEPLLKKGKLEFSFVNLDASDIDNHSRVSLANSFACLSTSDSLTNTTINDSLCSYVVDITFNSPIVFNDVEDGTYYLYAYVEDNAGNSYLMKDDEKYKFSDGDTGISKNAIFIASGVALGVLIVGFIGFVIIKRKQS